MSSVILILLTCLSNGLFLGLGFCICFWISIANRVEGKHWTEKPFKLPRKLAKEQREAEQKRQKSMEIMLNNIDVYDGTGTGQQDVDFE